MVTIDKVQRGLSNYVEAEILPHMSGKEKWMVAGFATLYLSKLPTLAKDIAKHPLVAPLGVITDEGIDAERIIASIKPAARSAPATFQLPFSSSSITMTDSDLDTLMRYITM